MKSRRHSCIAAGYREMGAIQYPGDPYRVGYEGVISARGSGLGRWVYCKYCYRNVRPALSADRSIYVCDECGYGLGLYPDHIPLKAQS